MNERKPLLKRTLLSLAVGVAFSVTSAIADDHNDLSFQRIASFPAFKNYDIDTQSVAEIVAASRNGEMLMYTDSANESLAFVDIKNPAEPKPLGTVAVGGEPTSVAVKRQYALVGVNTSVDFVNPSGKLSIINIHTQQIIREIELGGQPDSVAVSPDGHYAAIAIENERDEDLGDGRPPQHPPGFLVIVDLHGHPHHWATRTVELVGLADRFPEDPEPEYVDINDDNIAVVTLQENNHIVHVDLANGKVIDDYSAGTVDLNQIDIEENDLIELTDELHEVPREPDGVSWIDHEHFATADEGDLDGGSRGFTVFNRDGTVAYDPANAVEHVIVRHGHYPENRSENKGNEPENVETGAYGNHQLLFVGSERASVVLVYKLHHKHRKSPELLQVLPTLVKPEGLLAIPHRSLFIAAGEEDERGDKIRGGLSIYRLGKATYPTVASVDRAEGTPIPWGALSGLAIDVKDDDTGYTIMDSFYQQSRILKMDVDDIPAIITDEIVLKDTYGKLAAIARDPDTVINVDLTVNLDPEGIATRKHGGFWLASEGSGPTNDDPEVTSLNLLLKVSKAGTIKEVVKLPYSVNTRQVRFGFEGVTSVGSGKHEVVYVAFQREWLGDKPGHVRIGRYHTETKKWKFYYYPLEAPQSANGGWVGLSEIAHLGGKRFAVIERDNQAGPDAVIKRIYSFSIAGLTPLADHHTPNFPVVKKKLVRDLMPDLEATGGLVLEKIEGLAASKDGDVLVVNDNDGVDDSNGETQLLHFEELLGDKDGHDDEDDEKEND